MLLFEDFLCFFNNNFLKKIILSVFLFEFSSSEFSLSESEEISILSTIYFGIFFLQQHIYNLLKTLEDKISTIKIIDKQINSEPSPYY